MTIVVEGHCRMESRSKDQDSIMVMASWGNLNIDLGKNSVLEIEASPDRDKYTNIGIYMDINRTLTVTGPGTLKVSGGDARSDGGTSIALYAPGNIIFEKDCSVSIISDTASNISIGCWLEDGDFTLKDGSQIQIQGGKSSESYGIDLSKDREYSFNSENWTGSMTVSGTSGALRTEGGKDARIGIDSKNIHLTGYTDIGEHKSTILDKRIYKFKALQNYTKLYFEGCEN